MGRCDLPAPPWPHGGNEASATCVSQLDIPLAIVFWGWSGLALNDMYTVLDHVVTIKGFFL